MARILPFQKHCLEDSFRYLRYNLKPNGYIKEDWRWLVENIKRRIGLWCHKWLSHGGRLIPVKHVLEEIPMYWHTLASILKGILEKIKKSCCNFISQGSVEYRGSHWVNWNKVANPKDQGGWGLKDVVTFGRSLANKSVWKFISLDSLWKKYWFRSISFQVLWSIVGSQKFSKGARIIGNLSPYLSHLWGDSLLGKWIMVWR
jgi:hypothetical protein